MFEDIFNRFHEKNKEVKVIGVWGKDGLELEKKLFIDISDIDMEFAGAEMADIISKLENIKLSPDNYFLKLNFQDYHLLIYSLTQEFFLMMLTDRSIIPGKLKFYLELYKSQLTDAL